MLIFLCYGKFLQDLGKISKMENSLKNYDGIFVRFSFFSDYCCVFIQHLFFARSFVYLQEGLKPTKFFLAKLKSFCEKSWPPLALACKEVHHFATVCPCRKVSKIISRFKDKILELKSFSNFFNLGPQGDVRS